VIPKPIETFPVGDTTVEIHQDPFPDDPRSWDNLGTMVCGHRRYTLGDEHHYDLEVLCSWEAVEAAILRDHPGCIILPLYLFDHSGITISTDPERFRALDSAGWDWGQVGLIFVPRENVLKEWSAKRLTRTLRERAEAILRHEVETYDDYLTGRVGGFVVKDAEGNQLDCCWGMFGGIDYVRDQARQAAEAFSTPALAL
jgi:hypothetical protein